MEVLAKGVKDLSERLEVNASAHKEEEEQCTAIAGYQDTLGQLSDHLSSLVQSLERRPQEERRDVLKDVIPSVLISTAAHCGKHYWTSSTTRQQAHGVVTQILQACGCGSVPELLIGQLPAGHTPISPYLPAADNSDSEVSDTRIADDSATEQGTVNLCTQTDDDGGNHSFISESSFRATVALHRDVACERLSQTEANLKKDFSKDVTVSSAELGEGKEKKEKEEGEEDTDRRKEEGEEDRDGLIFRVGLLKPILSVLRRKLTKESWKTHPTAKHALVWCLKHLQHPHVGQHLDSFLPPVLMLLDDFEIYHKVLGLSAVRHLLQNVDPTELRWYGRADVIYEAIKTFLYMSEPELIHALHPCMVRLLPIVEGPRARTASSPRKPSSTDCISQAFASSNLMASSAQPFHTGSDQPTKTDDVFAILLNSLDFESKLNVRKAYVAHVQSYISLLGIYTVRHLKRLLAVLYACLEFPDHSGEQTRRYALQALTTLISCAWPRIPSHKEDILRTLMKLVSDLCPSNKDIPEKQEVKVQLKLVTECFVLVGRCCDNMQVFYRALQTDCDHLALSRCLEECLRQLAD